MRSDGSSPTYCGRTSVSHFFNGDNEYGQLIRAAISGAVIRGASNNKARIVFSYGSTTDPFDGRSYLGGAPEANAARTVFLATPSRRAISLIATPSDRCKRRISAQFSTVITPTASGRGSRFPAPQGVSFQEASADGEPMEARRWRAAAEDAWKIALKAGADGVDAAGRLSTKTAQAFRSVDLDGDGVPDKPRALSVVEDAGTTVSGVASGAARTAARAAASAAGAIGSRLRREPSKADSPDEHDPDPAVNES